MLDVLRNAKRVYLATPYTKHPEGQEYAFLYAAGQLANLYALGVKRIYAPIVHWHTATLFDNSNILRRYSPDEWFEHNRPEMDLCDVMAIPDETGSQVEAVPTSEGIAKERAYFEQCGRPVIVYDLLRIAARAA